MRFSRYDVRKVPLLFSIILIMSAACITLLGEKAALGQDKSRPTTVAIHCNYAPVAYWDQMTNKPAGFFVEIMDTIAGREGLSVHYICKNDWAGMITSVESGESDISVLLISKEREKILSFSIPIEVSYLSYFARSHSNIHTDTVPEGYTVGVLKGSMSYEQLRNKPGVDLIFEDKYQDGIFSLLAGKIDIFAGEESMILKHARETSLDDRIKRVGKPFVEQERALAVRKGNVQLLELLNKNLKDIVRGPVYQSIYLKWYGKPTPYWTIKKILITSGLFLIIAICGMAYWRYLSIYRINRELVRTMDERKCTQKILQASEEKYCAIVENQTDFVDRYLPGGILTYVNSALSRYVGMPPEQLLGKSFLPFIHEDDRQELTHALESLSDKKPYVALENRVVLPDGSVRWHQWTHSVLFDSRGVIAEYQSVGRDITERKRAEEALQASESRYKAIVENQAEFVARYLPGGIMTFINDTFCHYLSMNREDLLGKSYYPFMHEEDRASFIRQIESLGTYHPSMTAEARVVLPDGRVAWHEWSHSAIFNKEGTIVEYQATGRDITDSRRTKEALRSSETRFRSIIEHASAGILVADLDTRGFLYANPEICRMLGYDEEDFRLLTITDLAAQEELLESIVGFQAHAEGKTRSSERTLIRKDGSSVRMSIHSVHIELDNRQCLAAFFIDVTEKQLLEEERLKVQKLEAIGTLAGGIAHDFNNLLQGVFGYISLAKLTRDNKDKSLTALEEAEKALHLTVKLTNQLLTFSKGGKPLKKKISLLPVIENAAKFTLSGSRSDYRIDVDANLWHIEADEGQIGQVIQNIVLNADQSMPEGGLVDIKARNIPSPYENIPQSLQKDKYAKITVKDSGIGIPEQYIRKIFDPYFTTKEKGSGLGLATSYSIIKNHDGMIYVTSDVGNGTTFHIYLPAVEAVQKAEPLQSTGTAASACTGKVLLMDDERLVRSVARELIKALGHEVEDAKHGEEAVIKYQAAKRSRQPFDVVILDLTIRGGMGGVETLRQLLNVDPYVRAIVSSGYSDDSALADYEKLGFKAFLKKPYSEHDLREVLNRILNS